MSAVIDAAVARLSAKVQGFDGVAKFVVTGEGAIMIDDTGVRAGDEEADVTLTANAEVFEAILEGEMNPTTAFMTGKLSVDGSMGMAMKLASVLS
ncbi:SCP-2 sterol transfer family protein [Pseudorhodobacter antarcticus]|jgi:putative sterol carrier protein|uniref:SCP-2 sterol transfer family protein n=1 Tax=Pseudorhodobacter antarcticus TaxID=1077947 RepID=A0A1H8GLI2_9RHOB|nr:SCP2 sterol-binding domain-containing protein [Pseudorhodobacter antarcticus]SEN44813.1 SCP-2 sterol transfer family protein [Pseudorhodobacter antarcticus]